VSEEVFDTRVVMKNEIHAVLSLCCHENLMVFEKIKQKDRVYTFTNLYIQELTMVCEAYKCMCVCFRIRIYKK